MAVVKGQVKPGLLPPLLNFGSLDFGEMERQVFVSKVSQYRIAYPCQFEFVEAVDDVTP